MADPEIGALVREQRRTQRVPRDARCEQCLGTRHLSPTADGTVLCYGCLRAKQGAGPTEADHPAGRRNIGGLTVDLPANDHRTVTEWRTRLGLDDWPDANGDPLITTAHFLAGMATLLLLVASWMVAAAGHIAERLGPGAWEGIRAMPVVP